MDSAFIGNSDWGMFDAWTQGKSRYIDRDNIGGVLLQGSALDKTLRWDLARVSLANYQGVAFSTGTFGEDIYANDANWIAQVKYAPSPDWNATLIASYARDKEVEEDDPEHAERRRRQDRVRQRGDRGEGPVHGPRLHGRERRLLPTRTSTWTTRVRRRAERPLPVQSAAAPEHDATTRSTLNSTSTSCSSTGCRWRAVLRHRLGFPVGLAARREQDVLLTEGQEGTWQWGRPDYNFGNRSNQNSMNGLGWGGWNGEVQQVVSGAADNDFTDFDEPVAFSVIGWKGITLVPKYAIGDWEFAGEYSYIDFNTNWQACGGTDKDIDCQAIRATRA
jgi:hypothetical protein